MEIATLILAAATVILSWNFLKELLTGVTKNTRRIIRGVDITTRGWLADASIEELEKATRYCAARGWSLKREAEILAYWLAMDVAEAEVSQQKKLATELAEFLKLHQQPAPTAAPTPAPTQAP
jgi:predicted RecB family nuclease